MASEFSLGDAVLNTAIDLEPIDEGIDEAEKKAKSGFGRVGDIIKGALGAGIAAGAVAVGAGLAALGSGVADAREAAKIMAQTEAVIKSTGGAAGFTAQQIADMSGELSAASGKSLFGDSDIQQGQNLLLTFTEIKETLPEATSIMVDMAQAMGTDVKGGAIQLGKALNDPIAGISALSRVGVSFTDQQKEQIKTLQESGDVAGAQRIILAELNKEFGGSAKAAADADGGWAQFNDRMGEVWETLGALVLPLMNKFAAFLNDPVMPIVEDVVAAITDLFATFEDAGAMSSEFGEAFGYVATKLGLPGEQIQDLIFWIQKELVPAVGELVTWFQAQLPGAIGVLKTYWDTVLMPVFGALVDLWQNDLAPALTELWTWFQAQLPGAIAIVSDIWQNTLLPAIQVVSKFLAEKVIPTIGEVVQWLQRELPPAIAAAQTWFQTKLIPALQDAYAFFQEKILPVLMDVVTWVQEELPPAIAELVRWFEQELVPALQTAWAYFEQNILPVLSEVVNWLAHVVPAAIGSAVLWIQTKLIPALQDAWRWLDANVIPVLIDVAEWLMVHIPPAIAATSTFITEKLIPALQTAADFLRDNFFRGIEAFFNTIERIKFELGELAKIPDQIATVFRNLPEVPGRLLAGGQLPGLADGTDFWEGGPVRLAERGMEAILPPGVQVLNAPDTRRLMQGGGSGSPIEVRVTLDGGDTWLRRFVRVEAHAVGDAAAVNSAGRQRMGG